MEQIYTLAILFFYSLIAVLFDLKKRIIPNLLNYLMWIVVLLLGFYYGQFTNVLLFGVASFIIAYVFFKIGVWAGGDAKYYVALSGALPLLSKLDLIYLFYIFIVSAFVCIPVIGALNAKKVAKHIREINLDKEMLVNCAKSAFVSAGITTAISLAIGLNVNFAIVLFLLTFVLKPPLILAAALLAIGAYMRLLTTVQILLIAFFASTFLVTLIKFFLLVQKRVLREEKRVKELKEGEIAVHTITLVNGKLKQTSLYSSIREAIQKKDPSLLLIKGQVLCDSSKAGGLSKEEIERLKNANGLQSITVRKSIAFAPALAIAYFAVVLLL